MPQKIQGLTSKSFQSGDELRRNRPYNISTAWPIYHYSQLGINAPRHALIRSSFHVATYIYLRYLHPPFECKLETAPWSVHLTKFDVINFLVIQIGIRNTENTWHKPEIPVALAMASYF
ncbi:hypothetical protein RF11_11689 [Thelohanellus kitauei]|uniref:Uncharacterized protein n=1 Tax=Thelohanellus kitauei TaxID=669202 RepID=A0A0C2MDH2_THEKT|nr:hypothetical protein RF11_11689 [Thelohanellus kitauei]